MAVLGSPSGVPAESVHVASAALAPPYSNRGVTLAQMGNMGSLDPFFDAYFATSYVHPWKLLDHLEQALLDDGHKPRRDDGPPVRFYASNTLLLDPAGRRLLSVRHGGANHFPFVEAKGGLSTAVANCLRENFDHAPSRLDSAFDFCDPLAFDKLHSIAKVFEAAGRKLDYAGAAPENPDRGTTIYLGSRKSEMFVRIYQKGLKLAQELDLAPDEITDELRNWVRVELEYKPDKRPARMKAVGLSATDIWGCSPWTHEFASMALSIDAKRVHMTERRESDHERAMRFMIAQYGATMLRQLELLGGSWDRFSEDLRARLVEVAEPA